MTSRNGNLLKSVSRVQIRAIPCLLAHEDGRVRVVYQVAGEVRQFRNDLSGDIDVSLCRDEKPNAGRREQRRDELPGSRCAPGPPHDARVGRQAQKFVQNRPGRVPGIRSPALALEPVAARRVKRRVSVSSVYEHVGVDGDHYRPSIA
jgi:hypothetical protein